MRGPSARSEEEDRAWRAVAGAVLLEVRVQPGARQAGLVGLEARDDGRSRLKLKVTAAPEGGKANAAAIALLAKALDLPKGAFALLRGESGRDKTLRIEGDATEVAARLTALVHQSGG